MLLAMLKRLGLQGVDMSRQRLEQGFHTLLAQVLAQQQNLTVEMQEMNRVMAEGMPMLNKIFQEINKH